MTTPSAAPHAASAAPSLHRTGPSLLLLALCLLAAPTRSQTVELPEPAVGTSGTILTVAVDGLGDKPPKVWLTRDDTKKRTKLKLLQASPTELVLLLKKAPDAGQYDLTVKPKGGDELELDEAFSVAAPQGLELVPPFGMPGQTVAIQGLFLGDRQGKVRIGGKKAKLLDWQAVLGADPDGVEVPPGQVLVRIPKQLPDGMYPVELSNDAGSALTAVALTLGGSDKQPKGKKPRLVAQVGDALLETKQVSHVLGPDEVEVHAVFPTSDLNPGDLVLRLVLDTTADPPASLDQAGWQAFVRYDPPHNGDGCGTCPFYESTSCTVSGLEIDGKLLRAQFQAELVDVVGDGPPLTLQAGQVTSKLDKQAADPLPPLTTPSIVSFSASDGAPAVGEAVTYSWELADVDVDLTSWTLEVPLGSEPQVDPVSGVASYTPLNAVTHSARLRLFQAGVQVDVDTVAVFPEGLLVTIDEPWEDQVFDEVLPVRARVGNTVLELTEVVASVGDMQVPLVAQGGDFVGELPLVSLTPGLQELVVSASDLGGSSSQASRGFDYDIQPVLAITEPANWSVATPELLVQASGSDADGGTVTVSAWVQPNHMSAIQLASSPDALDEFLDLSGWSGETIELDIKVNDGTWTLTQSLDVYVEDSEALEPLGTVPGELIDLNEDGSCAVIVDRLAEPATYGMLDLATWIVDPIPIPEGYDILPKLSFQSNALSCQATLTGALYFATPTDPGSGRALVDWNLGELIIVSDSMSALRVAGDYASFIGKPGESGEVNRWRFSTTTLVNQIVNGDADQAVNELGDVYWKATDWLPHRIWRKKKGMHALPISTDDSQWHQGLLVDGTRALYTRRTDPGFQSGQLVLHDGDAEIQVREYQPYSVVGLDYRLAGEWVAFNRQGTSGQRQAWVRDPAGVETKASPFADDSRLEALADDGTLMFTVDDRRYLWRGSGTPDDVGAAQGRPVHRGGQWFLLLGNTLFHVP